MSKRKSAAFRQKEAKVDSKTNTTTASGKVLTPLRKPFALEEPVPRKTPPLLGTNVSALELLPQKQYALRDPSAASPGVAMISVGTTITSEATNLSEVIAPDKFSLSD